MKIKINIYIWLFNDSYSNHLNSKEKENQKEHCIKIKCTVKKKVKALSSVRYSHNKQNRITESDAESYSERINCVIIILYFASTSGSRGWYKGE